MIRLPNSRAGFSLLEVLISFGILVMGMVPLLAVYGAATTHSRESQDIIQATLLANKIIADTRAEGNLAAMVYDTVTQDPGYPTMVYWLKAVPSAAPTTDSVYIEVWIGYTHNPGHVILTLRALILQRTP